MKEVKDKIYNMAALQPLKRKGKTGGHSGKTRESGTGSQA